MPSEDNDINPVVLKELFEHCHKHMLHKTKTFPPDDYLVLDVETTGLSPVKDRIIQLGYCVVMDRTVVARYSAYINPGIHIPEEATAIHGITDEVIQEKGLSPASYYPVLSDLLKDYHAKKFMFVGHCFANFDGPFIETELQRNGVPYKFDPNEIIDTGMLIKGARVCRLPEAHQSLLALWKSIGAIRAKGLYYNLERYCYERFDLGSCGVKAASGHDASHDAYMTHIVLEELRGDKWITKQASLSSRQS